MPRWLLIAAALAAPAAAGAAASASAPVTALSAAQGHTAVATAWSKSQCERVVFHLSTFGPRICPAVSTGRAITSVEVAGARVLWLAYAGGNTREWTLATATTTRPRARQLRFVARDVDSPAPIVLGPTDGSLLVYAESDRVVALRPNGSRAFVVSAPAPITAVAAHGGALAAASGSVVSVAHGDSPPRAVSFTGAVSAVAFSGERVLAQIGRRLELEGSARSFPLPVGAQLQDADPARAAYVAGGKAHLVELASGTDSVVGPARYAQLDRLRLVLASGARVVVRPL